MTLFTVLRFYFYAIFSPFFILRSSFYVNVLANGFYALHFTPNYDPLVWLYAVMFSERKIRAHPCYGYLKIEGTKVEVSPHTQAHSV